MRLALRALGWLALAALLGCLGAAAIVWRGSERLIHAEGSAHPREGPPGASARLDPQTAAGLSFESVRFRTAGGSELDGWLVPAEPGAPYAIAFVHGAGQDRRAFLDHLPFLHEAGYTLLLFDLRGHGASDGAARGSGLGYRELHDVSAAVRYLKRDRGHRGVAVFGISLGASAALLAAAGDRDIDLVLAEVPLASLDELARSRLPRTPEWLRRAAAELALLRVGALGELRPIDVVGRIATPLVLIGSAGDRVAVATSVEALFAAAREPKELWIAERGEHGAILGAEPEEYRRRILTYLRRWLGSPVADSPPRRAPVPTAAGPAP